jgi:hypothetical protein
MANTTPRLSLIQPLVGDPSTEDRLAESANASVLDGAVQFTSGSFSALPTPSTTNKGSFYKATDVGILYGSTGTQWVPEQTITSTAGGSVTAKSGQFLIAGNVTITLPAVTAGAVVGVQASSTNAGSVPATVASGGGNIIFGVGCNGVSSILLGAANSFALFRSDGTNWYIVAGQQDTGWVALTPNNGANYSVSPISGFYGGACRLRGDIVSLRGGVLSISATQTTQYASLPSSLYYPPQLIVTNVDTALPGAGGATSGINTGLNTVSNTGALSYGQVNTGSPFAQNSAVFLDGISWPTS